MDRIYKVLFCCVLTAVSAACGTVKPVAKAVRTPVPTAAQADSLMGVLTWEWDMKNYVVERNDGPYIYGLCNYFHSDTSGLKVITLKPSDGGFVHDSRVIYDCYPEYFSHYAILDSLCGVRYLGRDTVVVYAVDYGRGDRVIGGMESRSLAMYDISSETVSEICFTGKLLKDGRIEGMLDDTRLPSSTAPSAVWARSQLLSDPQLLQISRADLLTDNAIEWWNEANPDALGKASTIKFGQLDPESSMVEAFAKADKEKKSRYSVAEFDIRGYSVIVCHRKATDSYVLCWAEPVGYRGRQLNTVYFENENSLAMYYYHGNRVYKYHLNLANGRITR